MYNKKLNGGLEIARLGDICKLYYQAARVKWLKDWLANMAENTSAFIEWPFVKKKNPLNE